MTLCRELTKKFEEAVPTTLGEAPALYADREPRGEYVLVLEGSSEKPSKKDEWWSEMTETEHVEYHINAGLTKNDAIRKTAKERGLSKNYVYNLLLGKK